ncbi:MAG: superinfection immunity protein [Alphaproteobacteria bacterium]|nr:superinfection immunity protein [Alphaproteobacteria bacterium]
MSGLAVIAIGLAVYFLPALIACSRHHHNASAIFVLNLLAGWTVIGWIAAIVWAHTVVRRAAVVADGSD